MKKVVAAVIAAGVAVVAAPAGAYEGPCAQQRALFEKYNIEFNMHQEQVEYAYSETCRRTG